MIRVAIIDYGSGNLHSAAKSFERAANAIGNATVELATDPKQLAAATHIVLPGVGAFGDCKRGLAAVPGMIAALEEEVLNKKKPFFGICVGMQLLATKGLEHGEHDGLGWIKGTVKKIDAKELKIPHMGWNTLEVKKPHACLEGESGKDVYFVHSYHFVPEDKDAVLATVQYGAPITAAVAKGNIFGTQFHPEKSQKAGLQIISNFLKWRP